MTRSLKRMIQEELRLILVLPSSLDVEPRDVSDAFHPDEVVPIEDAWAGGDNLVDDLDHARFETGESNAGPHVTINEKKTRGRKMRKLSRLNRIIIEEGIRLLREGHGCGCAQCPRCEAQNDIISLASTHGIEPSDVGCGGSDMEMDQDSAFGAGYSTGQEEREEFDYTGDLSDLTPEEAMGLGRQAGMMGLGHDDSGSGSPPHSESYDAVRGFLQANPDLVDMAVKQLMKMAGASCPKSAQMAIVDHLTDIPHSGDEDLDMVSLVGGGS